MKEKQNTPRVLSNVSSEISIEKAALKVGLITCASLIIYFMIMKYFNFMNSAIAWGLNFIILGEGINLAYRYYRSKTKLNVGYVPGLILGGMTTAVSVVPFIVFLYIYFSLAGAGSMLSLRNNIFFMGGQITPLTIAGSTIIEGLCSGVIISFMMMQYFSAGLKKTGREIIMQG